MGFWSDLGSNILDAAKSGIKAAEEKTAKWQSLKMKYQSKSDEELMDIIKGRGFMGSTTDEKVAASSVWKERHGQ